jgi:FAD/FMN-containing dehydrogenase
MDKILEIDSDDLLAVVQPGVINNDLDQAARKQGLFYAPDPGSKPISSIGGNAATNADGMSTVRFGATKDNILGLKVILADGRIVKLGGTISGEHAVGMLKNQWNNVELGENVDELQHQIKSLLDPMGILNPKRKID